MKRFIHIIFAGLFFITTTGFTVTKHYCSGNLVDVAINSTPKSCCDMGGGCCSNESVFYQLKDEQTLIQSINLDNEYSFNIKFLFKEIPEEKTNFNSNTTLNLKTGIPPPNLSTFLAQINFFRL